MARSFPFPRRNGSTSNSKENRNPDAQPSIDSYVDSYSRAIGEMYKVGGFPLVVFGTGGLVLVGALVAENFNVIISKDVIPYLMLLVGLLAILGSAMYLIEVNWKRKMIERALDRHDEYLKLFFTRHVEHKNEFSLPDAAAAMTEVMRITQGDWSRLEATSSPTS